MLVLRVGLYGYGIQTSTHACDLMDMCQFVSKNGDSPRCWSVRDAYVFSLQHVCFFAVRFEEGWERHCFQSGLFGKTGRGMDPARYSMKRRCLLTLRRISPMVAIAYQQMYPSIQYSI
jgi:hypothetical protein